VVHWPVVIGAAVVCVLGNACLALVVARSHRPARAEKPAAAFNRPTPVPRRGSPLPPPPVASAPVESADHPRVPEVGRVPAPVPSRPPDREPPVASRPSKAAAPPSPVPLSEDALKKQLLDVPEIALAGVDELRGQQLEYAKASGLRVVRGSKRDPAREARIAKGLEQVLRQARDAGLPVRTDASCALSPKAAETLGRGAADLRWSSRWATITGQPSLMNARLIRAANGEVSFLDKKTGKTVMTATGMPRSVLRPVDELRKLFAVTWPAEKVETTFNVVPVIEQVLQVENKDYRSLLVEELARIPGPEASRALARRALYDTSPDLRQAARTALKERPAAEFRDVVLKGLDYPWPAVADHAAKALVETRDVPAVPALVKMLDRRGPALPYLDEKTKQHKVRELVRINHMRNCCLCHAPSYSSIDWAPGRVMEPGVAIPAEYYGTPGGAFVRADIAYVRPDFSVTQPVERAAPWPTMQRYDYMVRTRPATAEEVARARERPAGAGSPQRVAILAALRGLSRKDLGATTEAWRNYAAEVEARVVK
jgi:hypothetical protein